MYKITCVTDGIEYILHSAVTQEYKLIEPKLTVEVNHSGTLEFQMPFNHPNIDNLRQMQSEIFVYESGDTEPIWVGRLLTSEEDLHKMGYATCEGILGYLLDSQIGQYINQAGVRPFMAMLVNNHNNRVDSWKRFALGDVTVEDDNDYIHREQEEGNYTSTLDTINDKLINKLGGYLKIRFENGARYLDYVATAPAARQTIRFGENLVDFVRNVPSDALATAIIPVGAEYETTSGSGETAETVTHLLNITGYQATQYHPAGADYVFMPSAVARFGYIFKKVEWKEVTEVAHLYSKALAYLQGACDLYANLEITAVDLSVIDETKWSFRAGESVRVVSAPHGVDQTYMVDKIEYDLADPANTRLSLGGVASTYTRSIEERNRRSVEESEERQNRIRELSDEQKTNRQQIEAEIVRVQEEMTEEFAGDLADLKEELEGDLTDLQEIIDGQLDALAQQMAGDLADVKEELEGDISALQTTIEGEMDSLAQQMAGDLADVKEELEGDISALQTTIDGQLDALAQQMAGDLADVKEELEGDLEDMQDTIEGEIESATDLLSGADGGNIIIDRDANGKPTQIFVLNAATMDAATSMIVLNQNGFGFRTRASASDQWGSYQNAWTIDGTLVAQFITAVGTVTAGSIGGWTIGQNTISKQIDSTHSISISATSGILFQSGQNVLRINQAGIAFSNDGGTTWTTGWGVDGTLVAQFITAVGTVTAGSIGGWTIGQNTISKKIDSTHSMTISAANGLSFRSGQNVILISTSGIAFSSDGGSTFTNAWNVDGTLSADFITAAKLVAGTIGGWTIGQTSISNGTVGTNDYASISTQTGIQLGTKFGVTKAGALTAESGTIGGWTIGTDKLTNTGTSGTGLISLSPTDGIELGSDFSVNRLGEMTAQKGTIGPWEISSTDLRYKENGTIYSKIAPGELRLVKTGSASHPYVVNVVESEVEFAPRNSSGTFSGMFYETISKDLYSVDHFYNTTSARAVQQATDEYHRLLSPTNTSHGVFIQSGQVELSCNGYDNGRVKVKAGNMFLFPGTTSGQTFPLFINNEGRLAADASWSSSIQLKECVTNDYSDDLNPENLLGVAVVQFKYKDGAFDDVAFDVDMDYEKRRIGFLIEDLDYNYPAAVKKDDPDDPKTWAWSDNQLIPPMLKLIQDQNHEIEQLKARIEHIEGRLS